MQGEKERDRDNKITSKDKSSNLSYRLKFRPLFFFMPFGLSIDISDSLVVGGCVVTGGTVGGRMTLAGAIVLGVTRANVGTGNTGDNEGTPLIGLFPPCKVPLPFPK